MLQPVIKTVLCCISAGAIVSVDLKKGALDKMLNLHLLSGGESYEEAVPHDRTKRAMKLRLAVQRAACQSRKHTLHQKIANSNFQRNATLSISTQLSCRAAVVRTGSLRSSHRMMIA